LDSSSPPQLPAGLILAALPAFGAAVFAAANAALAALPEARKTALRDALQGKQRQALERYLQGRSAIESRWLICRALGITSSALWFASVLPESLSSWRLPVAGVCGLVAYGLPAEVLTGVAEHSPQRAAVLLLRTLRPFELCVAPLAAPLAWVGALVRRWVASPDPPSPELTESEVEHMVKEGEQRGLLGHDQSEMIRNVLDFGDLTTGEVVVPRTRIQAFELRTPGVQVLERVRQTRHSRYPVYRDHIDNIVGILYAKDLLSYVTAHDAAEMVLEQLMRTPVPFLPEAQPASSVLREMRAGRHHMAIVIDEFGGVSGIVTLEDLLEEIVGDIRDEHDAEEPPIQDLGDGRLLVDAAIPIGDLSRYLGTQLPVDGDYHSLGGFIVDRLGRVPRIGATLKAHELKFVVREADDRKVAKVEIVLASPPESMPGPSSRAPAA
jgi:putative hemolysin